MLFLDTFVGNITRFSLHNYHGTYIIMYFMKKQKEEKEYLLLLFSSQSMFFMLLGFIGSKEISHESKSHLDFLYEKQKLLIF